MLTALVPSALFGGEVDAIEALTLESALATTG
jgi:hypothetical protein